MTKKDQGKEPEDKDLEAALQDIRKQYGDGALMRLGDEPLSDIEVISTGAFVLDKALGAGGLPKGRIVEIFSPEGVGKTTLALHVIAEAQRLGGTCAFVDAEHALNMELALSIGVDIKSLLINQPSTGEQGLNIVDRLVRSGSLSVIVVDSVAALVPRSELEGEIGDASVGVHSRMMSQSMRKLTGIVGKTNTIVIFINQLREKIGVMFGSPETQPGGRALKFYSSVRIDMRAADKIKNGDAIVGHTVRATVVKNRVGPPHKKCEFDLYFGRGIDNIGSVMDIGVALKQVKKAGAWYSYGGIQIAQGREAAKEWFRQNPEEYELLYKAVKNGEVGEA